MAILLGIAAILVASMPVGATEDRLSLPENIPAALQIPTECMVEAAKAARGVKSATRGVMTRGDTAFVFVRFEYWTKDRDGNRYEAIATYSHERDAPLKGKFPDFGTWLSGLSPECDVGDDGKRDCSNVRSWWAAKRASGPVPGWGTDEVLAAWRNTCGVTAAALWS